VNSVDLLKVNNIEDPKKLQIGQRLQIPSKLE
jgi:LysM repeat protein